MDQEIQKLIRDSYNTAGEILRKNAQKLNELSTYLLDKETISGEEFMDILGVDTSEKIMTLPSAGEE